MRSQPGRPMDIHTGTNTSLQEALYHNATGTFSFDKDFEKRSPPEVRATPS